MNIGDKIKIAMARKGYTALKLSEISGINNSLISQYVTGSRSPSDYTLDKLSKALEVSPDFFHTDKVERLFDSIDKPMAYLAEEKSHYNIEKKSNPFSDVIDWMRNLEGRVQKLEQSR